jgi:drug/metabolite transporter (DMT)-like permease
MSPAELGICFSCLACSSVSQLFMKGAAISGGHMQRLIRLCAAGSLQLISIGLAVLALQTLRLSQIVPFAAGAYLLVPLGSYRLFGERLRPSFWLGTLLIIFGILCTLA